MFVTITDHKVIVTSMVNILQELAGAFGQDAIFREEREEGRPSSGKDSSASQCSILKSTSEGRSERR